MAVGGGVKCNVAQSRLPSLGCPVSVTQSLMAASCQPAMMLCYDVMTFAIPPIPREPSAMSIQRHDPSDILSKAVEANGFVF